MVGLVILAAAFLGPLGVTLWSYRLAVRPRPQAPPPTYFAFAQRTQWVGLCAVVVWLPAGLRFALPTIRAALGGGPAPLEWAVAATALAGPPMLTFAALSILGFDVARRVGLTEWTWREARADAALLLGGTLGPLTIASAATGMLTTGGYRGGALGLAGAAALAIVLLGRRQRGAGLTLHAVTSGELRDRVFTLAERAGVTLHQLYVVPLRRVRLANAFAVHNNVVLLTDILLGHLDRDEVDAVLAHELAHLARKDPAKLARGFVGTTVIVAAASVWGGFPGMVLGLAVGLLAYLALARHIEYATDAKAIDLGAKPQALVTGLARLSHLSQVPVRWSPVRELLLTHPALERRARRIAARAGIDPVALITLMDRLPAAGERWAMPGAVASPRAFGSEFRRRVIGRMTWSLLAASVLAPALVVWAALLVPVPRLAVLALAILAGLGAWQMTWLALAYRPLAALRRALAPVLHPAGAPGDDESEFFVGLAPHATPRLYEGFAEWDVGFLAIAPGRLEYAGEEARFSLATEEVRQLWLDAGLPGWIRVPIVRVRWERADGAGGTFGLVPVGAPNPLAARSEARRIQARLAAWREHEPPSGAVAGKPRHASPPTMDVTCSSPRSMLQAPAIVLTWIVQTLLAIGVALAVGLPTWPLVPGVFDVVLAAIATHILALAPVALWREPPSPQVTADADQRRAA